MIVVEFQNKSIVKDWMLEEEKVFRLSAEELVTSVIQKEDIFNTERVTVNFFNKGVASVVALISDSTRKVVMKTCFKQERGMIESLTFQKWNDFGIRAPKIISQGEIKGRSYFIMEYLEEPTVGEYINHNLPQKEKFYSEIGLIFSKIHSTQIKGFGGLELQNGKLVGKYDTLKESVLIEMNEEISEETNGALEKLSSTISHNTIGHFDFGPHHFFSTNPITIFDPDPEATLPIIDLAAFLIPSIDETDEKIEMRTKVVETYIANSKELDLGMLPSALVLRVNQKTYSLKLLPSENRNKRADFMLHKAGSVSDAERYLQKYF